MTLGLINPWLYCMHIYKEDGNRANDERRYELSIYLWFKQSLIILYHYNSIFGLNNPWLFCKDIYFILGLNNRLLYCKDINRKDENIAYNTIYLFYLWFKQSLINCISVRREDGNRAYNEGRYEMSILLYTEAMK